MAKGEVPKIECEILPSSTPSPRQESVEWNRPDDIPGVHVIDIENSRLLVRMFHATFSMTALSRANSEWYFKGASHRSLTGGVIVWEPGDFHRCVRHFGPDEVRGGDASTSQTGMVIEPEILEGFAAETRSRPPRLHLKLRNLKDREVYRSQRSFYDSLERPATRLERQTRFADCARILLERVFETSLAAPEPAAEAAAFRRARNYIEDHYAEEIRLEELAAATGLNRFAVLRLFKRHLGVPPHQYQVEVRISRARQLLDRKIPLAIAAADVGFSDQSHFTRHFQRVWRMTPGEYVRLKPTIRRP
jgi:AraC-like DNA-binding protein